MRAHVLIVDDDRMMLEALSDLVALRLENVAVDGCESAMAALERIRETDYDAIVSDIKMPGMDGLQLMERTLTMRPTTPTLLVTGHGDHELGVNALKAGAYAFIQKPIDRDYFVAWLKRAIQLRQLSRALEQQNEILERVVQERTAELKRINWELHAALEQRREQEEALRESEARFRGLFDSVPVAVFVCDRDAVIQSYNRRAVQLWGREPQCGIERHCGSQRLFLPNGQPVPHDKSPIVEVLRTGVLAHGVEMIIERPDGSHLPVIINFSPLRNGQGEIVGAITSFDDMTERKRVEQWLVEQKHALDLVASGRPLEECLTFLTDVVTRLQPNVRACVLMADETGTKVERVFAAHLPPSFGQAIRGAPIDDLVIGTCGMAVSPSEPVTCPDIAYSERWSNPWLDLCRARGILACHSTPVFRTDGQVVAFFFLCFSEARKPSEWELRLAEFGAHVVSIVIERDRARAQLDAELADTKLLQGISAQLISEENVNALYEKLLDAAVAIMRSDYASMQMLYPERCDGRGELLLLGHRGFTQESAEAWKWVRTDTNCVCGEALRTGQRVIVPDVEKCEFIAGTPGLETYRRAGIRAVQSTPLRSRAGNVLGMISTHWRQPHQPSERDLRLLDILARQAADLIERKRIEEALRQSHAELRAHAEELARFNRAAAERERRIIELKKEINELCARQGLPTRYPLEFEQDG